MTRIKALRERKKMNQGELALKIGKSQPYVCDLENGRRGAKPETLQSIAAALGCTLDELLKDDPDE